MAKLRRTTLSFTEAEAGLLGDALAFLGAVTQDQAANATDSLQRAERQATANKLGELALKFKQAGKRAKV